MSDTVRCPEQIVFGLDIGTRSIVGTVGYMDNYGFHVIAMEVKQHDTRAMIDGQVHDIATVGEEIKLVREKLEKKLDRRLTSVCIAAAGRVLRTITVKAEIAFDEEIKVDSENIYAVDLAGVEMAHRRINEQESNINYYCVGYTPVKYYLNDYEIGNLEGHKATRIGVSLLATFLPEEVVDGLYAAVEYAGLEVANLTLEPIAAMNVAIPEQYRLLNIALVDVGAGTSDICITKDGSIVAYGMIPSAGDEISEMIAKNYLVDFTHAEKIKLAAGGKKQINFKDIMGMKQSVTPEEVVELVRPVTDRITREVADKIIKLNGGKPVSAVFVVGGGGKIPGYTASLAGYLDIPQARVALRGKEVLTDVEFAVTNVKKDSLYVTPVGICVNYYNQKNNFIMVTVNGERIKLYDNSRLTVIDAIMQAGYPNEKLFPRRGEAVNYTLNGVSRMIRGSAGEPANIFRNGKPSNMNAPIEKNDYIDIEESTVGESEQVAIGELAEFKNTISFVVNDKTVVCPCFAYVNGRLESDTYIIQNGDVIVMENFYTVEQLLTFMDVKADTHSIYVNNEPAFPDALIYENFSVRIELTQSKDTDADNNQTEGNNSTDKSEQADSNSAVMVVVNNRPVVLTGKKSYVFVDILDFYPFDVSKMGGEELVMTINGNKAEFVDAVGNGDIIEIYWR